MAITFVPNDPLAQALLPARRQSPRPEPPPGSARFHYPAPAAEDAYPIGSAEFLFWQCREAALATLETWVSISTPLARWQNGATLLPLHHDGGKGLNARYDRSSLKFMTWEKDGKATLAGASTDAVAHELGHALLDTIRPDLWNSVYTEAAAFHESFADCIALLVGFFDAPTRRALLQSGATLRDPNPLECLAEDMAEGVLRESGPQHPQSLPRRALNTLRWAIPINLPPSGPPSVLSTEAHSFGRIFTGCFYDTICKIFADQPHQDEEALLEAARVAGHLLVAGAKGTPEVARFFQGVGRAMILADQAEGGDHHLAIRDAFANHDVSLGSSAMLSPTSGLRGPAPHLDSGATRPGLSTTTRRHLLDRLGATRRGRLRVTAADLGGRTVTRAVHRRDVRLTGLHPRLRGVIAPAAESVLIGTSAASPVVLGELPDSGATEDETAHFVGTLLTHDTLSLESGRAAAMTGTENPIPPTHAIRTRGGRKVLTRVRFACLG